MNWESWGIALLTASLVRPLGLAVVAWLMLRLLRVRHPASRHAVWTAVLIGMLLLPVLSVFAPRWKVAVLPRKHDPATVVGQAPGFTETVGSVTEVFESSAAESGVRESGDRPGAVSYLYFAGLLAVVTYRVVGWVLLGRLRSRSRLLRGRLRESEDVVTPVAVGVWRPVVILPEGWRGWTADTKRAVLAHEFAHLRRHDTLVSALARVTQCVFWFHPLAWWLSRRISELAELACDAAVLERVDDPAGYSRILLEFADAVNRAGRRVALPGLAMATSSGMDRRIDGVFELSGGELRKLSRPGVLLGLLGLPVMCLAATVGLGDSAVSLPRPSMEPIVPAPLLVTEPAPVQRPAASKMVARQSKAPQAVTQSAPAAAPKFEVVSVKPCKDGGSGGRNGGGNQSPGTLRVNCQPVKDLIRDAYDLLAGGRLPRGFISRNSRTVPIEGGPAWINSDRYNIDAKAEGPQSYEMMRGPMMRTLLEDRFQLKIHRETRQGPVFDLEVVQGGAKLEPVENGKCTPVEDFDFRKLAPGQKPPLLCNSAMIQNGKLVFFAMSLADFCQNLAWNVLDRPVIDRTGIAGKFNFRIEFAPDEATPQFLSAGGDPAAAEPAGPSIFTALQQQLGLKVERATGPVEFLVIDHIERPSEN